MLRARPSPDAPPARPAPSDDRWSEAPDARRGAETRRPRPNGDARPPAAFDAIIVRGAACPFVATTVLGWHLGGDAGGPPETG